MGGREISRTANLGRSIGERKGSRLGRVSSVLVTQVRHERQIDPLSGRTNIHIIASVVPSPAGKLFLSPPQTFARLRNP